MYAKGKTFTQNFDANVNIHTDARRWTDGKTKTIYPMTYFVCRGYNELAVIVGRLSEKHVTIGSSNLTG